MALVSLGGSLAGTSKNQRRNRDLRSFFYWPLVPEMFLAKGLVRLVISNLAGKCPFPSFPRVLHFWNWLLYSLDVSMTFYYLQLYLLTTTGTGMIIQGQAARS